MGNNRFNREIESDTSLKQQTGFTTRSRTAVQRWIGTSQKWISMQHHKLLKRRSRKAFQEWLDANNAWTVAKRLSEQDRNDESSSRSDSAKEIEKRIDAAADAHEAATKALQEEEINLKRSKKVSK